MWGALRSRVALARTAPFLRAASASEDLGAGVYPIRSWFPHGAMEARLAFQRCFTPIRTKRHRTPRSTRRPKPMIGFGRRLMPASTIYKHKRKVPKGYRKLSFQEVEHEKFKVMLTRIEMGQCAWTSVGEQCKIKSPPELRRAATSWNPFDSIPTVKKRDADGGPPPIKMKKRVKKVKVSTVVSFNGMEAGRISGGRQQRRLIADRKSIPRARKPAQLPPSEKRLNTPKKSSPSKS